MPRDFEDDYDFDADDVRQQVEDLALAQAVSVQVLRDRATTHVHSGVSVHSAHLRDRDTVTARGRAREVRRQAVICVLDRPLLVGDVFYLALESDEFDAPPSFAICERCQLLDGPAFETAFRLLQDIELSQPTPR